MKVHEAIAQALADTGVEPLFGLIGDANLYMVDSFIRQCDGRYIRSVHEAGAVLMALGYGQVTGRVGAATITHGPALTNALTALAEGVKSATPMVLLVGDTPVADRGHLQNVNQRELVIDVGAGFEQLRAPDTIAEDVSRAFARAQVERRPIVLNMPIEFQWLDTQYEKLPLRIPDSYHATTSGTEMDNAIGIIASARRPLVLVGRGAIHPQARAAILRFAERIEAPLATTLRGKELFADEPFNLGICGTLSNSVALDEISKSDCIIAFGASLNQYTSGLGGLTKGKWIVHVSPYATDIGRYTAVEAGLVGDPGLVADAVVQWLDAADIPGSGSRTDDLRNAISAHQPKARMPKTPRTGTVDALEALRALDESLPADRIYVTDAGRFLLAGWTAIKVQKPQDYVHTLGFAAIGLGLGEAIGAAVAAPDRPTLLLTGDGGMMLGGLSELTTAVREELDIIVVVCNDGCYGAEHRQFVSKDMDPAISLLDWPDFAPVAQALGADAVTVSSSDELQVAMSALSKRDRKRPFLIDLKLDPALMPDPHL